MATRMIIARSTEKNLEKYPRIIAIPPMVSINATTHARNAENPSDAKNATVPSILESFVTPWKTKIDPATIRIIKSPSDGEKKCLCKCFITI